MKNEELRMKKTSEARLSVAQATTPKGQDGLRMQTRVNYGGQAADSCAKIVSKKENSSSFLTRVSVALWHGARGLIGLKFNIKF